MRRRQQHTYQSLSEESGARVVPAGTSGAQQASGVQQTQGARQVSGVRQAPAVVQKSAGRRKSSKRQRATIILAALMLLVGLCLFAYPSVSNYLFQQAQEEAISIQDAVVSSTDKETLDAMYAAAVEYNEQLFNTRTVITDPFDEDTASTSDDDYDNLLNLAGDGVMATITIPAIDVQLVIYHGTTDEVLEEGVGHLQGSSLPVGGESTHAVLAGHTGLPNAQIFDNIDQLEVGDYFIITVLGEDLAYSVTSIEVVLPEETDSLVIQEGEDLVTLVTCTPYGVNTHRLLVHAERCEIPEEWLNGDTTVSASTLDRMLLPSILIGLAIAAAIIAGWRLISYLRKRRAAKRAAIAGGAVRQAGFERGGQADFAQPGGTGFVPCGGVGAANGAKSVSSSGVAAARGVSPSGVGRPAGFTSSSTPTTNSFKSAAGVGTAEATSSVAPPSVTPSDRYSNAAQTPKKRYPGEKKH